MPITTNATYHPVTVEFLAHWAQVNAVLSPQPLVLQNGVLHGSLDAMKDELQDAFQGVQSLLNGRQIARNTVSILRGVLMEGLGALNMMVDTYYGGTIFDNTRPKMPGRGGNYQEFTDPMMDGKDLWARIETQPPPTGIAFPLVLPVATPALMGQPASPNMDLVQFTLVYDLHRLAYEQLRGLEKSLELMRRQRDMVMERIYEVLKNYRLGVGTRLPSAHALLTTVPRLTPEKGHTPEPVNASAVFVPPDQAKVVFTASEDSDLDHYELHGVPGEDWSAEDAVVVASLPKTADPREFITDFSLTQPGAAAAFAVYVVLGTGNVKGSAPMTVLRPA